MKKLLVILLFISTVGYAQNNVFLRVDKGEEEVFCGVSISFLELSKKQVRMANDYGELDLKVVKRKNKAYYICEDKYGEVYDVYTIQNEDGGVGIVFKPRSTHLYKFIISNAATCGLDIE